MLILEGFVFYIHHSVKEVTVSFIQTRVAPFLKKDALNPAEEQDLSLFVHFLSKVVEKWSLSQSVMFSLITISLILSSRQVSREAISLRAPLISD